MFTLPNANLWNESLKVVSQCPLCQSQRHRMKIRLLGQDGETRLLHLRCSHCGGALLALVLIGPGAVSSIGVLTDLSAEDTLRFSHNEQVFENDVLAVHQFLQEDNLFGLL